MLNDLENLFDILKIKNLKKIKNNSFIFFIEGKYYEKKSLMDLAVISYSNSISCDKLFFDSYARILNILETINNLRLLEKYLDLGFKNLVEEHHINILTLFRCILLNRKKRYKESKSIPPNSPSKLVILKPYLSMSVLGLYFEYLYSFISSNNFETSQVIFRGIKSPKDNILL